MSSVLITGASSGLGQQLALDYAKQGKKVYATGRSEARLSRLCQHSPNIEAVIFDVADKQATEAALMGLPEVPDLIVLNAGNCEYLDEGRVDTALFERVFSANFFGVLHCIEALQSQFTSKTHLVLVGSSAAYLPLPRAEAYGASKAALAYFAHSLRMGLSSLGVTVSLVSPGFIKTPLTDKNDFPMPMRVSVEHASREVQKGVEKKKLDIHFPSRFTGFMRALTLLPLSWRLSLIQKMIGRQ
ncbi:SDR family NAD(P)-dependent oxidoreductase [Thaumasiovibrio subtropicus]|uniref:SDR family NAD(P)-dependent oxidoreductase n=1 Tax=Thaumasiovibrio subtropicus TaxID=1891207 RepID=UPI000B350AF0|nr:SDR family NAD(P)-dependent oxidoreductase [Thaumasiovibrio subtropicus]